MLGLGCSAAERNNVFPIGSTAGMNSGVIKLLASGEKFNPLNAELNYIRHLLALVGARHIVHVSRIRVKKSV
jgi:hypothetical protein